MNLNATLIVQAANFLIAYCLLRIFLLKPAVSMITRDKQVCDDLKKHIDAHNLYLVQRKQKSEQRWLEARVHFVAHAPSLDDTQKTIFSNILPEVQLPIYDQKEVDILIADTATQLTEKIKALV